MSQIGVWGFHNGKGNLEESEELEGPSVISSQRLVLCCFLLLFGVLLLQGQAEVIGNIFGVILGLYGNNGKENGNYYSIRKPPSCCEVQDVGLERLPC